MYGAYGSIGVLDLQDGYPVFLGPTVDNRLVPILNGAGQSRTSHMSSNKTVTLVFKIFNPLRNLQVYVLDANKKKDLGQSSLSGRTIDVYGEIARLPDGDYSLAVVARKPFLESDNLDDGAHESWVSLVIRIKH